MRADILQGPQAFSAGGKPLILASASALRLFDTPGGKERAIPGHRSPITPRFSADGRTLFTTCGETRRSWDASGKRPTLLGQEQRKPWEWQRKALSADGKLFLNQGWEESRNRVRETATAPVPSVLNDNHLYPD